MGTLTRKRIGWQQLATSDAVNELEGAFIEALRVLWQRQVDGTAEEWGEFVDWVTEVVDFTLRDTDPSDLVTDD
jgi:hypothetical protein